MDSRGGVLRSYARLPLIPPTPFSHKGRRGSWGVLKPTTSEGTPGLPKRLPVREIEHGSRFSQRLNPMDETTPRAPSLRVLGVSACIRPAHAAARRRGDTDIVSVKGRPVACYPCPSAGYSSAHAGGDARAPFKFMGARASGAHISSVCSRCARLRRAYQQRLLQVRAPPARRRARRLRSQEARGSIMLPSATSHSPAGASRRSARAHGL
jgi:hypothetical protein